MRFAKWRFQLFRLDNDRLVHSLKTAIALLFGLLFSYFFKLPLQGQWVLISILVVMCAQSRVGAILQKSYMRFLGTVIGAIVASLTLWLVYPNVVYTTLILCVATMLFSYIADSPSTWSEVGPLGAVTLVVIVVAQNPSFNTVMSRFLEINLGIVIALLVSRFIWPLHSRTQLRYILIHTLHELKNLAKQLEAFTSVKADKADKSYELFEDNVLNYIGIQKKLFDEVMRETFGRSNLGQIFQNILYEEREILRGINLMKNALMHFSDQDILLLNQQSQVQKIYQMEQHLFQVGIDILENKKNKQEVNPLEGWSDWKKEIQSALKPLAANISDQFAIDLFIFSANRLLTQLYALIILIKKV
ncbi:MAG: FUSC family protein [Candidatus Aquirickettsiella gammari]